MMRITLCAILVVLLAETPPMPGQARQYGNPHFAPQQMLDLLARPLPRDGTIAALKGYPEQYADWSEEQRKSGVQAIARRCSTIFALENDNPATRLLPDPMTRLDEARLAMDVCMPAQLPRDWPSRAKILADAEQAMARARTLGAALQMPETLRR